MMPRKDTFLACVVILIWGVNFVAAKYGMEVIPPLLFAALRFTLVAFPAVLFVRPPGNGWRTVLACGATMSAGQFALLYTAMNLGMPAGLASLVLQIQTVFTVTIAAAASWGMGNVLTRRRPPRDGFSLVVWSALVAPLPLLGLSLWLEGWERDLHALTHLTLTSVLGLAFVTYGASMAGYGLWNLLLSRHAASTVSPWSMFVPVIGTVAAYFYNGETPTVLGLVGAVVIIVGVLMALGVIGPRRRPRSDLPDREHPASEPAGL